MSAETPRTAITGAMGKAVPVPETPTRGATAAPIANWSTPIKADALPAVRG
jgi:hypothetical protein